MTPAARTLAVKKSDRLMGTPPFRQAPGWDIPPMMALSGTEATWPRVMTSPAPAASPAPISMMWMSSIKGISSRLSDERRSARREDSISSLIDFS